MARKTAQIKLISFGIYTMWDQSSKELPRLIKRTHHIPLKLDVEFGYIINIKKAKNKKLSYCIDHPQIPDENGVVLSPFIGEEYIRQNDWNFFIGDTIWAPIGNKAGAWRISLSLEGEVIADETFNLVLEPNA